MDEIIEIKEYDIVKYLKSIYLVKDFQKIDDRKYRLNYYFRSIRKDSAKLHTNESYELYGYLAEKIRKADLEEMKSLISKIKVEHPNFDLSFLKKEIKENTLDLNIEDCIKFIKSKGYIIYKQI
jgi:hypothetical protein